MQSHPPAPGENCDHCICSAEEYAALNRCPLWKGPMQFDPQPQWYHFCAVQSPGVRLGRVLARTELQAKAIVEKFFFGGYFFPNQIHVWPELEIKPHLTNADIWI